MPAFSRQGSTACRLVQELCTAGAKSGNYARRVSWVASRKASHRGVEALRRAQGARASACSLFDSTPTSRHSQARWRSLMVARQFVIPFWALCGDVGWQRAPCSLAGSMNGEALSAKCSTDPRAPGCALAQLLPLRSGHGWAKMGWHHRPLRVRWRRSQTLRKGTRGKLCAYHLLHLCYNAIEV